jgi:hypothetical protein
MTQRHEELARTVTVALHKGRTHVLAQHVADPLGAMLLMQEIVAQRSGGNLGNMLMLGDGQHLPLAQTAQRNAIFQRDHGTVARRSRCFALIPPPPQADHIDAHQSAARKEALHDRLKTGA